MIQQTLPAISFKPMPLDSGVMRQKHVRRTLRGLTPYSIRNPQSMRRFFLLIALGLWLSGCGESRQELGDIDDPASGGDAQATATDSLNLPSNEVSPEEPWAANVALALEGEGLRIFSVPSGTARPIPFGSAMDSTLDVLHRIQPTSPREQGENVDCQAQYATWEDGLTVWFTQDRFVGWSVREGTGTLTTATGVGLGSTRAEWEASYVVQVATSSLGVEFTAGGMAGVLESAQPDARVVHLWAGHACPAR